MITKYIENTIPQVFTQGTAVAIESNLIKPQSLLPKNDYCYCAIECEYIEYAFADLSDNDKYKNDKSAFIFNRVSSAGVLNFELYKSGVKVADLNNDVLGKYYESFETQPFYRAFIVDWKKVAQTQGFGKYQIKAQINFLGQSTTFESRLFRLLPYSDQIANNTVKITSYQQGNIIGGDLDYSDLIDGGWVESYRIKGVFGFKEYEFLEDTYQNSDYTTRQIRDEIKRTYKLETRLLPFQVANWLTENASLSNYIEVTDYNIFNTEIFRDYPVRVAGFNQIETYLQKRSRRYVIDFVDRTPNLIKRNF